MANLSRAFENLGRALGPLAANIAQRERDRMLAMRQENLIRLRHQLNVEAGDREFEQRKELIGIEAGVRAGERQLEQDFTLSRDEAGRTFERELLDTRMQHEKSLVSLREGDTSFKHLQALEKSYVNRLEAIDKRMAEVRDKLIEQQADAQTQGLELDPTLLKPWQDELARLQEQRRQLGRQRDLDLARFDTKRYETLTAEEVQAELAAARRERGSDDTAAAQASERERTAATESPASSASVDEIPPPPPKPQGMIDREKRKERKVAPVQSRAVAQEVAKDNRGAFGPAERRILDAVARPFRSEMQRSSDYEKDVKAARAWKAAKREGRKPSAEVERRVREMSERRRAALGIKLK